MLVKPNEINLIDLLNDLKSRQKRRLVYLDFFLLFLINRFVFLILFSYVALTLMAGGKY